MDYYKTVNGVRTKMTPDEISQMQKDLQALPPHQPTMEERMAALEEENRLLKEKLNQVEILTGGDSV